MINFRPDSDRYSKTNSLRLYNECVGLCTRGKMNEMASPLIDCVMNDILGKDPEYHCFYYEKRLSSAINNWLSHFEYSKDLTTQKDKNNFDVFHIIDNIIFNEINIKIDCKIAIFDSIESRRNNRQVLKNEYNDVKYDNGVLYLKTWMANKRINNMFATSLISDNECHLWKQIKDFENKNINEENEKINTAVESIVNKGLDDNSTIEDIVVFNQCQTFYTANPQFISNTVNQLNVFVLDKDDEWHINQKINNQSLSCLIHEVRDKPHYSLLKMSTDFKILCDIKRYEIMCDAKNLSKENVILNNWWDKNDIDYEEIIHLLKGKYNIIKKSILEHIKEYDKLNKHNENIFY